MHSIEVHSAMSLQSLQPGLVLRKFSTFFGSSSRERLRIEKEWDGCIDGYGIFTVKMLSKEMSFSVELFRRSVFNGQWRFMATSLPCEDLVQ